MAEILLKHCLYIKPITDFDQFLDSCPFFRPLYGKFLSLRDTEWKWKIDNIPTFNEFLFQCTRLYNDPHPEEKYYDKYLNDAKDNLGTRYNSNLLFAMVRATFKVMKNKPKGYELFMGVSESYNKKLGNVYAEPLDMLADEYLRTNGPVDVSFPINPSGDNIYPWSFEYDSWKAVTNNFEQSVILEILSRYNVFDREVLLNTIECAFDEAEQHKTDLPF